MLLLCSHRAFLWCLQMLCLCFALTTVLSALNDIFHYNLSFEILVLLRRSSCLKLECNIGRLPVKGLLLQSIFIEYLFFFPLNEGDTMCDKKSFDLMIV